MKDPAIFVIRHSRHSGMSCARWALERLVILHSVKGPRSRPLRRNIKSEGISPEFMDELRRRNIGTRLENYGADWSRFESTLAAESPASPRRYPLVTVPATAGIDWRNGSLHIHSQTFLVTYEGGEPVFVTREPRSRKVLKVSLDQMRLLHRAWRDWPAVLPSMLLNVLWNWSVEKESAPGRSN